MEFVDEIKINRVSDVVLVSCSANGTVQGQTAQSSADEEIASAPAGGIGNEVQSWSGRRLEGTLVLTGHHMLLSSNNGDNEEIWLLHSNIDVVDLRGPGIATSNATQGPSTPSSNRSQSAASRIGAMASLVATQYNNINNAINNNNASINNGDTPLFFPDSPVSMAMSHATSMASSASVPPSYHLFIRCKNLQCIRLSFQNLIEAQKVYETLRRLSSLPKSRSHLLYPFFYRPAFDIVEDGWCIFDLESEYNRLVLSLTDTWRISTVNAKFDVCPSYPPLVLVPKAVEDDSILKVAKFRHHGRFPVLSYFHKQTQMVLLRSSQPLTGPNGTKRCKEDERFLNASLPRNSRRGYVIDTRSQANVKAAQAKGGGIEPDAHYPQWKRMHCNLERPQSLSESYSKLSEACGGDGGSGFLGKLNESGWLGHVKELLYASCLVAQCIATEDACVLVHGTEGLDTSLQVTSLAQVLLNPDARTIRGFQALITREWIAAGHPFQDRHFRGPFASPSESGAESPSFLLFLDCIHQIHHHHPCAFEFNEEFLVDIFEHSYSSKFGTFLGNNEKDRFESDLANRTVSLWSHVNHPTVLPQYINPLYEPNPDVIWASVAPQSLQIWREVFCRWQLDLRPRRDALKEIRAMKEAEREARAEVLRLRKELEALEKEAVEEGVLRVGFPMAGFQEVDPLNF